MRVGDRFAQLVAADEPPLAETFLAFAADIHDDVDVDAYAARIRALGRPVPAGASPREGLTALHQHLRAEGFRGDAEHYYDPANSFLDQVVDRRLGIPISLSVIWIEAGRTAGIPLVGIGMPMHFLVGLEDGDAFCDPFSGRDLLATDDAIALFGRVTGGRIEWRDDFLRPAPPREIVRRALHNLKAIYGSSGQLRHALWVEDHLLAIPGGPAEERRERASVLAALGRYPEAISDLRSYLETGPEDGPAVEEEIRRLVATMN